MIRWTHGHTAGGGVVAGLVIAGDGWPYFALLAGIFCLGVLTGRFWAAIHRAAALAAATAQAKLELARRKLKTEEARATEIRTRQRNRRRDRAAQQAAEDKAFRQGFLEGTKS